LDSSSISGDGKVRSLLQALVSGTMNWDDANRSIDYLVYRVLASAPMNEEERMGFWTQVRQTASKRPFSMYNTLPQRLARLENRLQLAMMLPAEGMPSADSGVAQGDQASGPASF